MKDVCTACGKHLGACETILSVEGLLYCSAYCAERDFQDKYGTEAPIKVAECSEEVNPIDIGIPHMNPVVDILMRRDDLTEEEANERINEVREMLMNCDFGVDGAESIMAEELGLEMDYIFDIL